MKHKIQVWRFIFVAISVLCLFVFTSRQALSTEIKLKAGLGYSLVFKANGDVYGWGRQAEPYAQFFNLGKVELATPTKICKLKDFIDIFVESSSAIIALKKDGTVWLLSGDLYGLSEMENMKNKRYPQKIKSLKNIIAVVQTGDGFIFLKSDGKVWEYGYYGDAADFPSLWQVSGLKDIQTIAAGIGHFLALRKDGTVWAWGMNDYGQLGDAPGAYQNDPVQIKYLKNIICIAAGENHSLALKADGTVWAWGKNDHGQLGCGTKKALQGIQKVKIAQGIVSLAAGGNYNMALRSDGTVWIWGKFQYSRKGKETDKAVFAPVQISGLKKIKSITTSADHSLALKEDGTLWAWGDNCDGQVGNGTNCEHRFPVEVKGLRNIVAISTGGYNKSYALTSDGKVWEWGQTGNDPNDYYNTPRQIVGLENITKISAGIHYNISLKSDKTVWVWGYESKGQNIRGGSPLQLEGLNDIVGITRNNLALKSDGTVWYWKCRKLGRVGLTEPAEPKTLEQVANLSNVTSIISNDAYNIALKADGTVWSWGTLRSEGDKSISADIKSSDSSISNKKIINSPGSIPVRKAPIVHPGDIIPKQISSLNKITAIEIGRSYCLALKADGTVWYWRLYPKLFLQERRNPDYSFAGYAKILEDAPGWEIPQKLSDLVNIVAISAGDEKCLALKEDGTVWGWKCEDDYRNNKPSKPLQIDKLNDVVAITTAPTGYGYHLALKKDGSVWAWGSNESGQLGTGKNIHQYIPTQVSGEGEMGYFVVN